MRSILIFCLFIISFVTSVSAQTLKDAIKLTDNEQFQRAANTFRTLLTREPSNPEIYYYSGENYIKSDEPDSARMMYEKGIQVAPSTAINYVGLGKSYLYENKAAEAKSNFDKALSLSASKNATVLMKIAEAYITAEKKDVTQAFNLLNTAMKLEPKNPDVYILMGDAFAAQNDGTNAIKNYERATELDKTSVKATLRIGQLYGRARNYQEALAYYKKAEAIDPNFAPAYSEQGELYYKAKQYDVAKEKYRKYLELSGSNMDAQIRYASFLFLSKDYTKAIEQINEIRKRDTTNVILNRLMAYSYFETGDHASGLKYINRFFAQANPKKIIASDYEYHGKLLSKTGNDSLAITKYLEAVKMDTTNTDLYSEIASAFMKMKKYQDAITNYNKKITTGKGITANDYFGLGRSHYYSKDYANADSAFAKVTELSPSWPGGYLWRARANSQLDPDSKQGLARPHYESYIEKVGADVEKNKKDLLEAYSYLGFYYYDKDKVKSKAMWIKVAELDPKNDKAKKALEGLK